MTDPGFAALEQRRSRLDAIAENSARYASSFVTFTTTGWGEKQSPDCQRFTTTFVRRPSVSHCMSLDGDKLVDGRFPRVTAGVHRWLQDEQGFYLGAWLFFVIETVGLQGLDHYVMPTGQGSVTVPALSGGSTPALPSDPNYTIIHDFTFTGVAMKSLPTKALAAALDGPMP